jgi:hypothetical protein
MQDFLKKTVVSCERLQQSIKVILLTLFLTQDYGWGLKAEAMFTVFKFLNPRNFGCQGLEL